ncbi:DivIVA domain-containing protein [bacterium]|nr:DivIVA domain-containing protein [bacterium]
MKITPLDIYQREFAKKKIGGLDDTEVYGFLKKIGREYESLYTENKALKEQVDRLTAQMKDYLELEKTLKQTLISAQKASGDLKRSAEKESELMLKEAEMQGERIIEEARSEAESVSKDIRELKKQKRLLKIELKTILESYMSMLDEEPPISFRASPQPVDSNAVMSVPAQGN